MNRLFAGCRIEITFEAGTINQSKTPGGTMKFTNVKIYALSLLVTTFGCNKPETQLVGAWKNVKTTSSIEFSGDHTGVILQRTNPLLPPNITFKWKMLKANEFAVEVPVEGKSAAPQALGRIEKNDTIVLDNDTFQRVNDAPQKQ